MEKKMVQENLLDAETRTKLAGRVEVLEKVKDLLLLPQLEMMTVQQVADYYEVDNEAIQKCYRRNKEEVDSDGTTLKKLDFWNGHFVQVKNNIRGSTSFKISDDITLVVPNGGIRLFSKRAILRIGMLLRDSKVAKEVRTQLLNIFEYADEEQRTQEILTEQEIYLNYARAALDGDKEELLAAAKDAFDYKNRHIKRLKESNEKLEKTVALLAHQAREWTPRQIVNRLCRYYATSCLGGCFGGAYAKLYQELLYKKNISLNKRIGGKCVLDRVREEEWDDVVETAAAMCIAKGIDVVSVINEVNASKV